MTNLLIAFTTLALAIFNPAMAPVSQENAIAQMNDESLHAMLDNMGLEPKKLSNGYLIAIKRDTWTYNIQLVISKDGSKVGFNSNLGIVENPDSLPAETWKKLLISNEDIDPSFFFFSKDTSKLYLHRVLDNRDISAAYLRKQIDNFCANIKDTSELWKFTK